MLKLPIETHNESVENPRFIQLINIYYSDYFLNKVYLT